jgi:tetratricopeptide (TPR) repeat protein
MSRIHGWTFASALVLAAVQATADELLTPEHYANAAMQAQERDDWQGAVKFWARAHAAAEAQSGDSQTAAIVAHEYGRALGVVCEFAHAERLLLQALAIDESTGGPAHMPLIELSRLKLDQKLYADSIAYFERAVAALDAMNASGRDPDAFAHFLEEYAEALRQAGLQEQADIVAARAERLHMQHRHSHGHAAAERTPFGTRCQSS